MAYNTGPYEMRSAISYAGSDMLISIPIKKLWLQTGFLLFWLTGWAGGEFFALRTVFRNLTGRESGGWSVVGFLLVWLTLWTVGGAFAGAHVIWRFFGRQFLRVNEMDMTVERRLFGLRFGKPKIYESSLIQNIRAMDLNIDRIDEIADEAEIPEAIERMTEGLLSLPIIPGFIEFNFGAEEVKIEVSSPQEAKRILERIISEFPIYDDERGDDTW